MVESEKEQQTQTYQIEELSPDEIRELKRLSLIRARVNYNMVNAAWQLSQIHCPGDYIR